MDENVSPEPFLRRNRKLRTPIQIITSPSTPKKGDVEAGLNRVETMHGENGGEGAESGVAGERAKDAAVGAGEFSKGGFGRGMSFMPRHHKSEVNPFINLSMRLPWHQCIKMVIVGVTLLPLRLAFTIVNVFFMWFFASLVLVGLSEEGAEKTFSWWRVALKYPICWCLRFQCLLFGFWWIRVKGKCAKKEDAPIIVSNHVSPFEPFFLVSQTQATPVQRIEDSRAPIVGKIQKAMQVMFVDRSNPASKRKCLKSIEERSDPASRFPRVLVFPEGTCTNQRALITFKHGPFIPGKPIQPVTVRYRFWWLDPSFPAVAPSLVTLALRVMCQVWNCMEIEYLPIYVPSSEDRQNPTLFAQHVQEYMSDSLGVPATQHAFEDVALQFQAMKLKLNPEDAVVEWSRLRRSVDIDTGTAKEYLVLFFEMDTDRDGRLSLEEFCAPWRRKREAEAERRRVLLTSHTSAASSSPTMRWTKDTETDSVVGKAKLGGGVSLFQRELNELGGNDIETGLPGGEPQRADPVASISPRLGSVNKLPRPGDVGETVVNPIHAIGFGDYDHTAEAGVIREGGNMKGDEEPEEETGPLGLLREDEMKRAYDIFCGGEELDFQRFLTGLGVLSGLAREGRMGLFKFIFSMLQGRYLRPIYRQDLEAFIRRLRPDLTQKAAKMLLDNVEGLGGVGAGLTESEGVSGRHEEAPVTREEFLAFAEQHGSIISVYQAMILNDILGVERDMVEFGMSSGEDFGSLGVDTTELEKSLDELVGPAVLV